MFDYTESVNSDFFYSAMMMNSDMNYRTLNDLTEHNAIFDYRGLHNLDLLNEIAKGNFDLKSDTVHKVKKLIDSFSDIEKIANTYRIKSLFWFRKTIIL